MKTSKSTPKKKKKKKILSAEEKSIIKRQTKLHKDLLSVFRPMGFEYLPVNNYHAYYGGVKSELDDVFIFENLIIICEETLSIDKDHLRKKNEYYEKLLLEKDTFIDYLKLKYLDKFSKFDTYSNSQYRFFYIYLSEQRLEEEVKKIYNNFKYLDLKSLKYFNRIIGSLKLTGRNEFYKYLGIELSDVGFASTGTDDKNIDSAVIIPEGSSGFPTGIYLFSFLMNAEELMDCAYVLRKDGWDTEMNYFYQRLVEPSKVESIRKYLAQHKRTFIDNIIVSLPDDISFQKKNDRGFYDSVTDISELQKIENLRIRIPYKINSIGIIDGQHRVFGHYKGTDSLEIEIAKLRKKRHLLVTGLYFTKAFSENKKRKFESELFLHINSQQKKVDSSLLQYIQNLQSPNSPVGIAISVLNYLNNNQPFLNLFFLSPLDTNGIKTPTIINYALKDLLEVSDTKETLFKYWTYEGKENLFLEDYDQLVLDKYIEFASKSLAIYFSAIKDNFKDDFTIVKAKESKLLSVTSIVAFLLAYKKSLEKYKSIKDFTFYKSKISQLRIDFSKKNFPFVSSQWPKFVEQIENEVWN